MAINSFKNISEVVTRSGIWEKIKPIIIDLGLSISDITLNQVQDDKKIIPHLREVFDEEIVCKVLSKLGISIYQNNNDSVISVGKNFILVKDKSNNLKAYSTNPFSDSISFIIRAKHPNIVGYIDYIPPSSSFFTQNQTAENNTYGEKLLTSIIDAAIKKHVSDIHIYPRNDSNIFIKFRVYGEYIESNLPDININEYSFFANTLLSYAKDNPGNYSVFIEKKIVFRGATIRLQQNPTIHNFDLSMGGSTVPSYILRVHSQSKSNFVSLEDLNLEHKQKNIIAKFSRYNQGVIIVAGPTGSGKTTFLYAMLDKINRNSNKVIQTIEDPVEITIPGIKQLNINEAAGVTYNAAMLASLRSDNDVVLVGETRSDATARKMIELDETGHLVLTTLHAKNTLAIIERLRSLGVNNLQISDSLKLLISTRLVKVVCKDCCLDLNLNNLDSEFISRYAKFINLLATDTITVANNEGCSRCNDGYTGRTLISETVVISKNISELILNNIGGKELYKVIFSANNDNNTFWQDGIRLIKQGLTTIDALEQVLPPIEDDYAIDL